MVVVYVAERDAARAAKATADAELVRVGRKEGEGTGVGARALELARIGELGDGDGVRGEWRASTGLTVVQG